MTTTQIETLFWETLNKKESYGSAIENKLQGISEDKLYNWRKARGPKPTIGDMLNMLYQLKLIKVEKISAYDIKLEEAFESWKTKTEI
jgi:hypothetical protein